VECEVETCEENQIGLHATFLPHPDRRISEITVKSIEQRDA
jgi:hypothetical protein